MEKFDSQKYSELMEKMPFSYASTSVYLNFCAYVLKKNDEKIVVKQDPVSHKFQYIFLPENQDNWEEIEVSMASKEDVKKIEDSGIEILMENPTEIEFIYSTKDFLNPTKNYKQKINQFEKGYKYTIYKQYDREKIVELQKLWEDQKEDFNNMYTKESNDFFFYCLDNLDRYHIEQVYIEVDEKLVGFVWGVKHSSDKWINLHIKSDYSYRGLSRFLNYEIAKRFADTDIVSLGTGCQDGGLTKYKQELGPIEEKQYYYIATKFKK